MYYASDDRAVKAYRKRQTEKGLCITCSSPAVFPFKCCAHHLSLRKFKYDNMTDEQKEHRRKYRRDQIQRMKDEGRCIACCAPLIPDVDSGRVKCINCRTRIKR